MAEALDDTLETIAVVSEKNQPLVQSVSRNDNEEGQKNTPEPVIGEKNGKKLHFESVSLEDVEDDDDTDEDGDDEEDDIDGLHENKARKKRLKKKKPKHVLVEDDSSSDDDAKHAKKVDVNPSDLTWLLWMWYYITAVSSGALRAAEFLGEKLAAFFGITTPKYQYVIDEYYRLKELEKEEEEKEQKEKENIAQRKMEDLERLEGGGQNVVLNRITTEGAHSI